MAISKVAPSRTDGCRTLVQVHHVYRLQQVSHATVVRVHATVSHVIKVKIYNNHSLLWQDKRIPFHFGSQSLTKDRAMVLVSP